MLYTMAACTAQMLTVDLWYSENCDGTAHGRIIYDMSKQPLHQYKDIQSAIETQLNAQFANQTCQSAESSLLFTTGVPGGSHSASSALPFQVCHGSGGNRCAFQQGTTCASFKITCAEFRPSVQEHSVSTSLLSSRQDQILTTVLVMGLLAPLSLLVYMRYGIQYGVPVPVARFEDVVPLDNNHAHWQFMPNRR